MSITVIVTAGHAVDMHVKLSILLLLIFLLFVQGSCSELDATEAQISARKIFMPYCTIHSVNYR